MEHLFTGPAIVGFLQVLWFPHTPIIVVQNHLWEHFTTKATNQAYLK